MTTPKQPPAGPSASLSEALTGKEGLGAPIREAPEPGGTLAELRLEARRTSFRFTPDHPDGKPRRLYLSLDGKDGDPKGFGKALGRTFAPGDRLTLIRTADLDALRGRCAEFMSAAQYAVPESEHPRDPADWPWSVRLLGDDRRACYRQRDEARAQLASEQPRAAPLKDPSDSAGPKDLERAAIAEAARLLLAGGCLRPAAFMEEGNEECRARKPHKKWCSACRALEVLLDAQAPSASAVPATQMGAAAPRTDTEPE